MQFDDGYRYDLKPRWGGGLPAHPQLLSLIAAGDARYIEHAASWKEHVPDLRQIPFAHDPKNPDQPYWDNGFLPGLDLVSLYGFMMSERPSTYLEIGSGNSTKVAAWARKQSGLSTRLVSIDPSPRAEVDALCDEVIRQPLEEASLEIFRTLRPGDILFFDGSHRTFQNSDVTVFFTEVLPIVAPGVLIQIHDILLPSDYPRHIADRAYSEQYLLAVLLLFAADKFTIEFANAYVSDVPKIMEQLDDLWTAVPDIERHGQSFWFRRRQ